MAKAYSTEKQDMFSRTGDAVHIHWNESKESMGDGEIYSYDHAKVSIHSNRGHVISAVIKHYYPTYDAELAAINKKDIDPDSYTEYQDARQLAYLVGDGWEAFIQSIKQA